MKKNILLVISIITNIVFIILALIYFFPLFSEKSIEPLSYSTANVAVSVSKNTTAFDYNAKQLTEMAADCGSTHAAGYFDELISKFSGSTNQIYNFKYTSASQQSDTFVVTLIPNKADYVSLDQFKKDFDFCAAGEDIYPKMLNKNWLLFVNSCGSGYDDGSGNPIGCQKAKDIIEPTLMLN